MNKADKYQQLQERLDAYPTGAPPSPVLITSSGSSSRRKKWMWPCI